MLTCPNINSKEWQDLVAAVGDTVAWEIYATRGDIPRVAESVDQVNRVHQLVDTNGIPVAKSVDMAKRINDQYINATATSVKRENGYVTTVKVDELEPKSYYQTMAEDKLADLGYATIDSEKFTDNSSELYTGVELNMFQSYPGSFQKADKDLEAKLYAYLKTLDPSITLKEVDHIYDSQGNQVNALGRLRIAQKLIEVSKDRDATTLPEEAFHLITLIMSPSSPLMQKMMEDVTNFEWYNKVKRDPFYVGKFGSNEKLYRLEAIGKVLADYYVLGETDLAPGISQNMRTGLLGRMRNFADKIMDWIYSVFGYASKPTLAKMGVDYAEAFDEVVQAVKNNSTEGILETQEAVSIDQRIMDSATEYFGAEAAAELQGYSTKTSNVKYKGATSAVRIDFSTSVSQNPSNSAFIDKLLVKDKNTGNTHLVFQKAVNNLTKDMLLVAEKNPRVQEAIDKGDTQTLNEIVSKALSENVIEFMEQSTYVLGLDPKDFSALHNAFAQEFVAFMDVDAISQSLVDTGDYIPPTIDGYMLNRFKDLAFGSAQLNAINANLHANLQEVSKNEYVAVATKGIANQIFTDIQAQNPNMRFKKVGEIDPKTLQGMVKAATETYLMTAITKVAIAEPLSKQAVTEVLRGFRLKRNANKTVGQVLDQVVAEVTTNSTANILDINREVGTNYSQKVKLGKLWDYYSDAEATGDLFTDIVNNSRNQIMGRAKEGKTAISMDEVVTMTTPENVIDMHLDNWGNMAVENMILEAQSMGRNLFHVPADVFDQYEKSFKNVLGKEYRSRVATSTAPITGKLYQVDITDFSLPAKQSSLELYKVKNSFTLTPKNPPAEPTTQKEVVDRIKNSASQVRYVERTTPEGIVTGDYFNTVTGEKVKYRASSYAKMKYMRAGRQTTQTESSPNNLLIAEVGTDLHSLVENSMGYYAKNYSNITVEGTYKNAPKRPDWVTKEQYDAIMQDSKNRLQAISENQKAIDPNGKAHLMLEQIIYNGDNVAGTSDQIVVYSNAQVSIYDIKSTHTYNLPVKDEVSGATEFIVNVRRLRGKRDAYSDQMDVYKYLLASAAGVTRDQFMHTRIVPISFDLRRSRTQNEDGTAATATEKNKKKKLLKSMNAFAIGTPATRHIPISRERTRVDALDNMLDKLEEEADKMRAKREGYMDKKQRESLNTRLFKLTEIIDMITLAKGVNDIGPMISDIAEYVQDNLDNIPEEKLHQFYVEADTYKYVANSALEFLPKAKSNNLITEDEYNLLLAELSIAQTQVVNTQNILHDKILDYLKEDYEGLGEVVDPFGNIAGGKLVSRIRPMSEYNHPVFRAFAQNIEVALVKILEADTAFDRENQEHISKLRAYGKSTGKSLNEVYRMLIDKETLKKGNPKLISMYDAEKFHKPIKEAEVKGDYGTIQSFFEYTEEGKKLYKEDLKEYTDFLKSEEKTNSPAYKARLDNWKKKHDLSQPDAWLSPYARWKYATIKDPKKYYSDNYRTIDNIQVLREYYEWYTDTMRKWNRQTSDKLDARFVATMMKDGISILSHDFFKQGNLKSVSKQVREKMKRMGSLNMTGNEFTIDDDVTGMISVPLMYRSGFHEWDSLSGKHDIDMEGVQSEDVDMTEYLNTDLGYTMQMFASAVHNKIFKEEVLDTLQGLRVVLRNTKTYKIEAGQRAKDSSGNYKTSADPDMQAIEAFDKFFRAYILGERNSGEDNKKIGKVVDLFNKWTRIRGLAFNWKASGAGNVYFNAQLKLFAMKDIHFNTETLNKARKMRRSLNKEERMKLRLVSEFMAIDTGNLSSRKAARNASTLLEKYVTQDLFYILFEKMDAGPAAKLSTAMFMEYGVDPKNENRVARLTELPKGTKSLFDRMTVDYKNKKVEVEGLTPEAFADFRSMAKGVLRQIKGTGAIENLALGNLSPIERLLLTFRSWMYALYTERYGDTRYNPDTRSIDMGKYRVLIGEMAGELKDASSRGKLFMAGRAITMLARIGLATPGLFNKNLRDSLYIKQNEKRMEQLYDQFITRFPELKDKISLDKFKKIRQGQLNAVQGGMQITALILLVIGILRGDWDDDEVPLYKENPFLQNIAYPLTTRVLAESTFFSWPGSFQELIKSPVPAIMVVNDIFNIVNNTGDIFSDAIVEDPDDKTGPLHYTYKAIPAVPNMIELGYNSVSGIGALMGDYYEE